MKTLRNAASLLLLSALIMVASVDMSATERSGIDVLHSFAGAGDGEVPAAALVLATDGNFYGSASSGGATSASCPTGCGTIFKMTPGGAVTILHIFTGGADGSTPLGALIQATDGKLYGTAFYGGASGMGTVFTVTTAGAFSILYAFTGGVDGANPSAALVQAGDGTFYGTTQFGGTVNRGTLFQINEAGVVLQRYTFTGGIDGAYPQASLIQATDGNLYGTNYGGTVSTFGRIFKFSGGLVTVLHTFASGAADGANPTSALVEANDGNFYGTTLFGGASNQGTAFKMTPGGTVTLLHSFTGGLDGASPFGTVIQAADGNLYGPTRVGARGYGTVYRLTLAGTLTVVHTFTGGAEGADPSATLVQAASGKLYGTAGFGGNSGSGVVFRLPGSPLGDFDGDGKADLTVYRPSNGGWYDLMSSTNYTTYGSYVWGVPGDVPIKGDFDGDGKEDVAIYRPSNGGWYILLSSTNYSTYVSYLWGLEGDVPVPSDYDGDGRTDVAIFRPADGGWYILESSTNYSTYVSYLWGAANDQPVPGDFDGDGRSDVVMYRPSNGTWYILLSSTNYTNYVSYVWGLAGDVPMPATDFDGDGVTDIAIYRPSNGGWYALLSSGSFKSYVSAVWGLPGDIPVPTDFDGDGKTDVAVYRPSSGGWYILTSSTNFAAYESYLWGVGGDIPVLERP